MNAELIGREPILLRMVIPYNKKVRNDESG